MGSSIGKKELKESILNFVKERDRVSFAELTREFGTGRFALLNKEDTIVFWPHLPSDVVDCIEELLKEKKLFLHPANILTYFIDGMVPKTRIVENHPLKGRRTLIWVPTVLDTRPMKNANEDRHKGRMDSGSLGSG